MVRGDVYQCITNDAVGQRSLDLIEAVDYQRYSIVAQAGNANRLDQEVVQAGVLELPSVKPNGECVPKAINEAFDALAMPLFGDL